MRASPAGRGRLPASTPVLFVIDGDPGAAHALRDDLSRRFGREFRIVCESAADAGLAALRELAGLQWYWKTDFFRQISDEAIDVHARYGAQLPTH